MSHKYLEDLIALLDLEKIEENLFLGYHPPDRQHRLFGGQIISQALVSAARTVDDARPVHSLHAYFLRPGDPSVPALFEVERIRDGRSFTTRRVVVIQKGQAIFNMDASFHVLEPGLSHAIDMPDLKPPDEDKLPEQLRNRPFLSYRVDHKRLLEETPQAPEQFIWLKSNGPIPDDAGLHAALLAYESDSALLGTARLPHRGQFERSRMQIASLDHSIWFHEPFRVDQWLLYALESPTTSNARGFTRGSVYTADGRLVASCHQEGLVRLRSS